MDIYEGSSNMSKINWSKCFIMKIALLMRSRNYGMYSNPDFTHRNDSLNLKIQQILAEWIAFDSIHVILIRPVHKIYLKCQEAMRGSYTFLWILTFNAMPQTESPAQFLLWDNTPRKDISKKISWRYWRKAWSVD